MATRSETSVGKKNLHVRKRDSLHALCAADDLGHRTPTLVLFRLLKLSNLISQPFFAEDTARYQISMNELRVLTTLARMGEAASHEVCTVAGMHPMNVSRAVAALSRQKRIQLRLDPDNRRRKLLTLTPKGWKLHADLIPHIQQAATSLFATLEPSELEVLSKLIDKMTARLDANIPADSTPPEDK